MTQEEKNKDLTNVLCTSIIFYQFMLFGYTSFWVVQPDSVMQWQWPTLATAMNLRMDNLFQIHAFMRASLSLESHKQYENRGTSTNL